MFSSSDAGASWCVTASAVVSPSANRLAVDPRLPSLLHASFWFQGVCRSHDGGRSWEPVPGLEQTTAWCMAVDQVDPLDLWVGGYGVWSSTDGGETWALHT